MKSSIILVFILSIGSIHAQFDQLDGSISAKENQQLTTIGENGSNMMQIDQSSENFIRVTIKSGTLYVASLCACTSKNEVFVLHASAALGDQTYTQASNYWITNDVFNWEVREGEMTAAAIKKRQDYFEKKGWVANTVHMGNDGETEFFISREILGEGDVYLALGLMTEANPEVIIDIPENGAGDCADLKLVSGDPKSRYSFDPSTWIKIN